jgi:hypothetical protein
MSRNWNPVSAGEDQWYARQPGGPDYDEPEVDEDLEGLLFDEAVKAAAAEVATYTDLTLAERQRELSAQIDHLEALFGQGYFGAKALKIQAEDYPDVE